MNIKRITTNAIFLALLIVSAFISIPISEISFTLQVLVVMLICLLLNPKDALMIIGLYFVIGLLGLPVFSQGGGPAYILKPSFGYLLGFIFVPLIRFLVLKIKTNKMMIKDILTSVFGLLFIYLFGSIYFIFIMKTVNGISYSVTKVAAICIIPFIPFDIAKIVAANLITPALRKIFNLEEKIQEIIPLKKRRTIIIKPNKNLTNKFKGR